MTRQHGRLSSWMWYGVYLMWPLTYAILVYDDLTQHETMHQRLLAIFTLDVIIALMWPIIWIYWIVESLLHHATALSRLVGF
jgi:hypothetical protein